MGTGVDPVKNFRGCNLVEACRAKNMRGPKILPEKADAGNLFSKQGFNPIFKEFYTQKQ